ncbi:MAG: cupin domain-containing protein [Acidimicrobiales bacterium]
MARNTRNVVLVAVVAVLTAAGCGSSSSSTAAKSFLRTQLAEGPYANVPATAVPMYEAVVDFPQPAGEEAPSAAGHSHPPGFLFGLTGVTRVNEDGDKHVDVGPGDALFAPAFVHHFHSNPGPGPNDWLFMGVRPESVREQPLPSPGAKVIVNSDDLPGLTAGSNYTMRLDELTVRPGGQSAAVKQTGPTVIYVLDGEVQMHQQSQSPHALEFGKTALLPAGAVYQVQNPFKGQAKLLVMTIWPQGQPADTPVSSASF